MNTRGPGREVARVERQPTCSAIKECFLEEEGKLGLPLECGDLSWFAWDSFCAAIPSKLLFMLF